MKILLLEDDLGFQESVCEFLQTLGYEVTAVSDGQEACDLIEKNFYHLFILDIKVPGVNGHEVIKYIRSLNPNAPIMITTSLVDIDDMAIGYELGCNEYLKKPFELKELLIRIQALLKRNFSHHSGDVIKISSEFSFHPQSKTLSKDGKNVNISSKESDLLALFLQNKGKILTKDEIFNKIWKFDEEPSELSLRVYIKNLRQILGKDAILNRRGNGYVYV